jgi:methionyl-tRNA formyltransferase
MKIIFMGTPDFALPSLEILLKNNYTVSAVVTAPDKRRGRGQQISFTPVKEFAQKHSISVLQPETLRDPQFISTLTILEPDLFIVVAFKILPKEVYSIPTKGSFNLHASLLPKYRGAAPINWAIINGEGESGVTTFFLQDKVDTGNIILQKRIPISDDMNAGELHDALSDIGSKAVLETVRLIESGNANPQQQDNTIATPAPKIFKETCRINWNQHTDVIHNFVRGLSPYPGSWTTLDEKTVKIYKCSLFAGKDFDFKVQNSEIGAMVTKENKKLFVKAADNFVEILELQQEGKNRMSAEEFLRGYRLIENAKFV